MFSMGHFEHLMSFQGKITEVIEFGNTPLGMRMDVYFQGNITGQYLSGKMKGVDYLVARPDGVTQVNVRAAIVTTDGANISVRIIGYLNGGDITDAHIMLLTGDDRYQWLSDKIIVGKGKAGSEGLNIDYFYEKTGA